MHTYIAHIWGRKLGAIGIMGNHTIVVRAAGEDRALLALYDTHEHITHFSITRCLPCDQTSPGTCKDHVHLSKDAT